MDSILKRVKSLVGGKRERQSMTPKLLAQFIKTADAKALDAECLQQQTPAPFFLNFSGSAP